MKAMMDELFETMILKLIEDKYITMENYFLDGTELEADANKYSFVWKKTTFHFEENLKKKIQETLRNIHEIAQAEALELDPMPIDEVAPEQLEVLAAELEKQADSLTEEIEIRRKCHFARHSAHVVCFEKASETDPPRLLTTHIKIQTAP